jgi:hypothetical protein
MNNHDLTDRTYDDPKGDDTIPYIPGIHIMIPRVHTWVYLTTTSMYVPGRRPGSCMSPTLGFSMIIYDGSFRDVMFC